MKITDEFRAYFDGEDLEDLDNEASTIFGLDSDLRIALVNEGWTQFARENKAPAEFFEQYVLGSNYVDCLPNPLRAFFEKHIRQSIATHETWEFDYLCPTPQNFRQFRMKVLPLAGGAGCLISNGILVEMPHLSEAEADANVQHSYVADSGFITQCSHCRRTRHVVDATRWDWVPKFVESPPDNVSHGICPTCFSYFYPSVDRG